MTLAILFLLTLGCTKSLDTPEVEVLKESALKQDLTIELSDAAKIYQRVTKIIQLACQQDNQCKTIGVGVSPCGGFAKHFVYSTESTNVVKLSQLAKIYNEQQKSRNKKEQLVGICRFIAPPKTMCAQQKCLTANNSAL